MDDRKLSYEERFQIIEAAIQNDSLYGALTAIEKITGIKIIENIEESKLEQLPIKEENDSIYSHDVSGELASIYNRDHIKEVIDDRRKFPNQEISVPEVSNVEDHDLVAGEQAIITETSSVNPPQGSEDVSDRGPVLEKKMSIPNPYGDAKTAKPGY